VIESDFRHAQPTAPARSAGRLVRWLGRAAAAFGMLAAAMLTAPAAHAQASPKASDLVKVELLAEPPAIRAGEPFWVAFRLTMKEHWHTYWRNPGDAGGPTEVHWKLPEGFSAGELHWPTPELIRVGPTASFGYEGEAVLLAQVTPPKDLAAGQRVTLAAEVDYLVCEKICIPGDAKVSLPLAVAPEGVSLGAGRFATAFQDARRKLPQDSPWPARFSADEKTITLTFEAGAQAQSFRSATFFPYDNTLIDNPAPQRLEASGNTARLELVRSTLASTMPKNIEGVLTIEEDVGGQTARHAFVVNAAGSSSAAAAGGARADGSGGIGLLQTLLLAMVAGMILNLMPCVFPVLSLKILHLTQHAGETAARVRLHGLAYTAGILVSFAALAGVLIAIRAAGAEIGWGFQLQSPAVVAGLAFVLFAMGLSLSGILHVGTSLTRVGNSALLHSPGLTGSFFFGVLATVVATPCTAPFMGAAVGYALTQPVVVGLTVFLALGFGLALPFLALSFAPALQRVLPRPGPWMETLKQFLAFPLYATVVWLIWVLSQQVGPNGLLLALAGLVLIAFGAWIWSLSYERPARTRRAAQAAAVLALLAVVGLTLVVDMDRAGSAAAATKDPGTEPFTQARLDTLLAEGRPVFVNMTAAWCITCLVNERTSLSTASVRQAFEQKGVVYLKGDWTSRNPEITRVLERFGRSGVPLYVLYRSGAEPEILPQILTESIVLEHTARL
jgi:thiol:disulfide interchange protein